MSDDDYNFTFSFGDGTEIFKSNVVDTPDGPTFSGPLSYARSKATPKEDSFLRLIWHDMWCPSREVEADKPLAWVIFLFGFLPYLAFGCYVAWVWMWLSL